MSIRTEKVAGEIKKALAGPVSEAASSVSKAMVTITDVKMSPDLSVAKVYISIYNAKNSPVEILHALENNKGMLRSHVAKEVRLRIVPELRFYFDDSLDQMDHIQKLLDKIKKEDEQKNREKPEE